MIAIRSMQPCDISFCAAMVCASSIGERYGFTETTMAETLKTGLTSDNEMFVVELDGSLAGFAWVDPRGAFSSAPYLRLIAVDTQIPSRGIGSALLHEFEKRTLDIGRDFCLLVSDFNEPAISFYERHGYRKAGSLPDFAHEGITEILMVKKHGGG